MKRGLVFFLLVSLFSKSYCSIEGNVDKQSPRYLKPACISFVQLQMKYYSIREPSLTLHKLEEGTLETCGTAFGDKVTSEKILFLQKIVSNFNVHSVVLKWFYFDENMLKIFEIFDEKLRSSVKSVTFKECYFPETFIFKGSLELNHVTDCSFIQCVANEESFKKIFEIFKNSPVTSLTISNVLDYRQRKPINTNAALERFSYRGIEKRLLKINDLKLDSFFPNIKILSLTDCSLDFNHFSLTSLQNLNSVDLNKVVFENFCDEKFCECFPTSVLHVKMKLYDSNFFDIIENDFAKKITTDSKQRFEYIATNKVRPLSVFSSVHFDMNRVNSKMSAIKDYVEKYGSVINAVTSVRFNMVFNHKNITNMLTLLTYFPNLDNIEVRFNDSCDASINDDEIRQLFSALPIRNVKKLSMDFYQNKETTAFYCFIVELMKLSREMTSLKFYYYSSNSFAINVKEMVERENVQFPNLDNFIVFYASESIDISIDLFYVAKYNIKNFTVVISPSDKYSIHNLDGLDQFDCFSVDTLNFKLKSSDNFGYFINKLLSKFPNVSSLNWDSASCYLVSTSISQYMKRLKNVIVKGTFFKDQFPNFLSLLPHDFELLEMECFSSDIEEFKRVFNEKFPNAILKVMDRRQNFNKVSSHVSIRAGKSP